MYLHTGWGKFACDLALEPGCQLTFLYEGDGEMVVKVFDDMACRRHYHTSESASSSAAALPPLPPAMARRLAASSMAKGGASSSPRASSTGGRDCHLLAYYGVAHLAGLSACLARRPAVDCVDSG
ncbi:hypothetical protein QYE76_052943 [Lolium multiflorum]|uniref:TF-B3 domain-containing protein n=1 Tax=Lolium multiflorum TaxID=4521 RepID=A0AAD8SVZ7_LOLMU|nr:hypothetical protein QYE76_052943 [Lolium multiflorum]